MDPTTNRKRVTSKPSKCPNPLFEEWLEEWRVEAANRNSDLQYCFVKALKSLRKYPIKLNSGKECLILKNFGIQLAVKLDRKLAEYRRSNPDVLSTDNTSSSSSTVPCSSQTNRNVPSELNKIAKPKKRKKNEASHDDESRNSSPKKKPYIPALRSGPYAILITMFKESETISYPGFMLKTEIINNAQNFCDSSFTRPDPGSHYTAWSSMSLLIKKGLVTKRGNPAKFTLTSEGEQLAEKLNSDLSSQSTNPLSNFTSPAKNSAPSSSFNSPVKHYSGNSYTNSSPEPQKNSSQNEDFIDLINDVHIEVPQSTYELNFDADSQNSNFTDSNSFEQLIFLPGDFQILLLVDTHETIERTDKRIPCETIQELKNFKTNFEVRHLTVGDFAWVARNKENKELVLPYIVERKRMDDLAGSIKDDRFHEQKFRLRQCGLQNVIYLIEKFGKDRLGLPLNTLNQAIVNTQVVDNFLVKTTNNHSQSMFYLSVLTTLLNTLFKDKTLISCARSDLPKFDMNSEIVSLPTFQDFSKFSVKNKNMKIQDVFIKHLLQLKGLSVEKATAIVQQYPTPRLLKQAFDSSSNPEALLANLTFGALNRNIGPIISKSIYQLYTKSTLP